MLSNRLPMPNSRATDFNDDRELALRAGYTVGHASIG